MDTLKIDKKDAADKAKEARQQVHGLIAALRWTAWRFDGKALVRLEPSDRKRAA